MSLRQYFNYCELEAKPGSMSRWNPQVCPHWTSRDSEQLIVVPLYNLQQSNVLFFSHLKVTEAKSHPNVSLLFFHGYSQGLRLTSRIPQSPIPSPIIPSAANHPLVHKRKPSGAQYYTTLLCSIRLSGPAQFLTASIRQSNFKPGNVIGSQYEGLSQLKWWKDISAIIISDAVGKKQEAFKNTDCFSFKIEILCLLWTHTNTANSNLIKSLSL